MSTEPICVISILDKLEDDILKDDILKDDWMNTEAQKNVHAGVKLAKQKLMKNGFVKFSYDELAVNPVQHELPVDYGTLRSHT